MPEVRVFGDSLMASQNPSKLTCSECGEMILHHPRFRFKTVGFCIRWLAICHECYKKERDNDC
jgi:hypothetical protein